MTDVDNDGQNDGLVERMKESPRTVSALIIILIVAAAIYAFSGDRNRTTPEATPNDETAAVDTSTPTSPTPVPSTTPTSLATKPAASPTPITKDELAAKAQALPPVQTSDQAYVETAQKGDGLTHLARRAATRWLADNQPSYTLTDAHRIYIEDYIRKHMDKTHVALGAQKTISFDLIKEAVDKAGQLNDQQLHNLQKYTPALK